MVSVVLTIFVLFCWWIYVQVSRKRQEKRWPARATIDNLNLSTDEPQNAYTLNKNHWAQDELLV